MSDNKAKQRLAQLKGNPIKTRSIPSKESGGTEREKAKSQSASLYQSDRDHLFQMANVIQAATKENVTNSMLIRIALELCPKDKENLAQAYKELRSRDGRCKST